MGIDSQSIYPHSPRLYNTEKSWNPKNGFETDKVMDAYRKPGYLAPPPPRLYNTEKALTPKNRDTRRALLKTVDVNFASSDQRVGSWPKSR